MLPRRQEPSPNEAITTYLHVPRHFIPAATWHVHMDQGLSVSVPFIEMSYARRRVRHRRYEQVVPAIHRWGVDLISRSSITRRPHFASLAGTNPDTMPSPEVTVARVVVDLTNSLDIPHIDLTLNECESDASVTLNEGESITEDAGDAKFGETKPKMDCCINVGRPFIALPANACAWTD